MNNSVRSIQAHYQFLSLMAEEFNPLKPSLPLSFPLKTMEDLRSRSYFNSFHYPFNISSSTTTTPLPPLPPSLPCRPRILVCHDMAGGYTDDDKWVQGGTNPSAYAIWHWYLIDVFVYFSHNLVTIPPPCWVNAAHAHGVKVLGTFITEWDEGRAICNTLLSTKESAEMYAERLTELAVALGFDGWLINMEVDLDVGQIFILKGFVNHLTKTMHSSIPGSLVIWYDSVTVDGNLSWQNQLNDSNKPFFDLCDGIFINYTWEENFPKLSATVADNRRYDVYMGIDVFGRNTYGGGQWTTNVALDLLKKDDVSAAIFAPGWVYETNQPPDFQTAQNRWWGLIGKSWGVRQFYPKSLPFYSNFDQGFGYHFSVDGCQISNDPWCNISCQTYQPFLDNSVGSSPDPIQFNVNLQDASFCGGGNITFKGSLGDNVYFTTRLFQGEVHLDEFPIHITYSVKSDGRSLLGLSLKFFSESDEQTSILFAYDNMNHFTDKFDRVVIPHRVTKFAREAQGFSEWIVEDSNISMSGHTLTEISVVCYKAKPKAGAAPGIIRPSSILQIVGLFTRKMLFHFQNWGLSLGRKILKFLGPKAVALVAYAQSRLWPEVNMLEFKQHHKLKAATLAQVDPLEFFASLGHITIKTSEQNFDFPPSTLWKVEGDNVTWATRSSGSKTVSIKIVWSLREGDSSRFPRYTIYAVKQDKRSVGDEDGATAQVMDYIGLARVRAFYISEFVVPPGILSLKFIIQVCGVDGACQKLDTCPAYILGVEGQ